MDSFDDNNIKERVREWVDSGYICNNTSGGQQDDVFAANPSKCDSSTNTSNPVTNPLEMASMQRSHNNIRAMDLIALNNRYNSFNSDISMSSISSIESILESRREDPEELLMAMGFGFVPEEQTLFNRIPQRFLESPSLAKGVNSDVFRNAFAHKDITSISSVTSFPTTDFRERSYSCGRISDRFRQRVNSKESLMKELPEIITSSYSSLPQTDSILDPANRKFLESQGKEGQPNRQSSKRLIIGSKSYRLNTDGDPLEFPKTPSPLPTTASPTESKDNVMAGMSQMSEPNGFNANNTSSQPFKRKPIQRQNCVYDEYIDSDQRSAMNDKSSEMSSSTTTLVETVFSGSNEISNDSNERNSVSQMDRDLRQINGKKAIEAALVVAIESLRLSLEFYKHQSLKMAKISSQKYNNSLDMTEEDFNTLSKLNELRENIHKEIVDMDLILNRHLQALHTSDAIDISFISQAQIFTEAIKKVKQLMAEQQSIDSFKHNEYHN